MGAAKSPATGRAEGGGWRTKPVQNGAAQHHREVGESARWVGKTEGKGARRGGKWDKRG